MTKTTNKTDSNGRYATFPCTNDAGGNKVYEFRGISRAWRFKKSEMEEMYQKGLLTQATPTSPFRYKKYLSTAEGVKIPDIWTDTALFEENEKTGSPDQKPLALYKRLVEAGSSEGDLVLDPFCGCATTIIAAKELKRRWIGVDRRVDARYHIITRLMGIDQNERKRLEEFATDQEWLNRQMQHYEMHYQTEPPKRADKGDQTLPELAQVYVAEPENPHTHDEMKEILINQFGLKCWGCNYIPPDKRYLHLDHIIPKSDGGTNHIDNRSLLCQPCNGVKSNTMSLEGLRRKNKREGYIQNNEPIHIPTALAWTRVYSMQTTYETIREKERQTKISIGKFKRKTIYCGNLYKMFAQVKRTCDYF